MSRQKMGEAISACRSDMRNANAAITQMARDRLRVPSPYFWSSESVRERLQPTARAGSKSLMTLPAGDSRVARGRFCACELPARPKFTRKKTTPQPRIKSQLERALGVTALCVNEHLPSHPLTRTKAERQETQTVFKVAPRQRGTVRHCHS